MISFGVESYHYLLPEMLEQSMVEEATLCDVVTWLCTS